MNPRPPTSEISSAQARRPVDWTAVRARVERASLDLAERDSARDVDALLRDRARALAKPAKEAASAEAGIDCVVFDVEAQVFAVEARFVREVLAVAQLTPLPGLPPTFRGLANVRSQILPVFGLRALLQLGREPALAPRQNVLVLESDGAVFGLAIDGVRGSAALAAGQVRTGVPGLHEQFLRGITAEGVIVLQLPAIAEALALDDQTS